MNYEEVLDFLYTQLPMYQRVGKTAFKKDLTNTLHLAKALGNPEQQYKSIHIAGTNGKGSTSHMLASVLQSAGYKVGLYTSPHLKSFRERIRVDGVAIEESYVEGFVNTNKEVIQCISPSFFEITVIMAFDYFASQKVDFAVIETGLGGRLDSTNVITPVLSIITSISLDHQDMLGDTIEKIAIEKAGIIKAQVPVVVGHLPQEATAAIRRIAQERLSELDEPKKGLEAEKPTDSDLSPQVVKLNYDTVCRAVQRLNKLNSSIDNAALRSGIKNVVAQTGLKGRWQVLRHDPLTICDVGHNEEAIVWLMDEIAKIDYDNLHVVWGMVKDKSTERVFQLLNKECEYYFCAADVPRAMAASELATLAINYGLSGKVYGSVDEAYQLALSNAGANDLVFVGGSTFVVAEIKDL